MEKNELYFGFVVNKKSKSIFKGGVIYANGKIYRHMFRPKGIN